MVDLEGFEPPLNGSLVRRLGQLGYKSKLKSPSANLHSNGAEGGIQTLNPFRAQNFKFRMYVNSTTPAGGLKNHGAPGLSTRYFDFKSRLCLAA